METQIQSADNDPIESFSAAAAPNEGIRRESEDHGLACNCGVDVSDARVYPPCSMSFHIYIHTGNRCVVLLRGWVWPVVSCVVRPAVVITP